LASVQNLVFIKIALKMEVTAPTTMQGVEMSSTYHQAHSVSATKHQHSLLNQSLG